MTAHDELYNAIAVICRENNCQPPARIEVTYDFWGRLMNETRREFPTWTYDTQWKFYGIPIHDRYTGPDQPPFVLVM